MPSKKYNVTVSERAVTMLLIHVIFLANVSPDAATRLHKEIIKEINELKYMPQSYPWFNCDEIPANKYRKKFVAKRYLLIYQIKDDNVFIDYILDCRQEYEWLL